MMIKCLICGVHYLHERRICHECETQAIVSGLVPNKAFETDKFLTKSNRVFKNVRTANPDNNLDFFNSDSPLIESRSLNPFLVYE